jgi:hypothetical protein
MRKITKISTRIFDRDVTPLTSEYKARCLTTRPRSPVWLCHSDTALHPTCDKVFSVNLPCDGGVNTGRFGDRVCLHHQGFVWWVEDESFPNVGYYVVFFFARTLGCASTNHKHWLGRKLRSGRKQGNVEHTVVPNVALWNAGFECMRIALLNVFADKESITNRQNFYCISIRELGYVNLRLVPPAETRKITTLRKEQVRTYNSVVRLQTLLSRSFWTD